MEIYKEKCIFENNSSSQSLIFAIENTRDEYKPNIPAKGVEDDEKKLLLYIT